MLSLSTLNKYDTRGMYKIYDKWPEIASMSYDSNLDMIEFEDIDHIVFSGMGGSGSIADVFSSILSKTKYSPPKISRPIKGSLGRILDHRYQKLLPTTSTP